MMHCVGRPGSAAGLRGYAGRGLFCLALLGAVAVAFASSASATIRYEVSFSQPADHVFHVRMEIPHVAPGETLAMPAWNALYQIRDFAYRVRDVEVACAANADAAEAGAAGGQFAIARKLDKQDWSVDTATDGSRVADCAADDVVTYSILWNEPGPFDSQLSAHHAFINLAEILMYLPDRRAEDTEVDFEDVPAGWQVIAELPRGPKANSFTEASYDALVDAPVEAGNFDEFEFNNDGAHFRVAVDSSDWQKGLLRDALQRITNYELKLMGGPPFQEYTFLFHIGAYSEVGGGGMEHMNSTAIAAASTSSAAAIAAHEFFHVWNVKRIRPQALQPVDYSKEQYTRALWFAEGVTSTYSSYALERTGLWSRKQFYADLASQIADVESRPARKWQSAEESSLDAWFEKYDDYNRPNRSISYYEKGQILGVMLDLAIRDATDDRKSLDDVMRRMNEEYAKAGRYYDDSAGVLRVVNEVSGKDLGDFFSRYISGTDEIPYDQFLGIAGLKLNLDTAPDGTLTGTIEEVPDRSARQRRIRDAWLRGVTE
jgi:predicted metalloprotease with PDZ domain